eukprot:Nk52_evm29s2568 gene=Nk52_evmTU29s2568
MTGGDASRRREVEGLRSPAEEIDIPYGHSFAGSGGSESDDLLMTEEEKENVCHYKKSRKGFLKHKWILLGAMILIVLGTAVSATVLLFPFGTRGEMTFPNATNSKPVLRFKSVDEQGQKGSLFKIIQLTDMHLTKSSVEHTVNLAGKLLDEEQPDLVVFTGDICNSDSCQTDEGQKDLMGRAFGVAESRSIPWAFSFGNWDRSREVAWTGDTVTKFILSQHNYTMNKASPEGVDGDSTFVIPIYAPGNGSEAMEWECGDQCKENAKATELPVANVYIFDSHQNDGCLGTPGGGCITPKQVEWYNKTSHEFRSRSSDGKSSVQSMAFFHIPLWQHMYLYNDGETHGHMEESLGIGCSAVDTGLFQLAKANGDIEFMSVGHDHNSDFQGDYEGIKLMHGRKTGYGSYGPPTSWGPNARGARVFHLKMTDNNTAQWTWETYIHEESGAIYSRRNMTLNTPGSHQTFTKCNGQA